MNGVIDWWFLPFTGVNWNLGPFMLISTLNVKVIEGLPATLARTLGVGLVELHPGGQPQPATHVVALVADKKLLHTSQPEVCCGQGPAWAGGVW